MKSKLDYLWSVTRLPIIAVLVGFLVGAVCIVITGNNPITAYLALFKGSLGSLPGFGETLYKVTPILFTGLAAAISFRCGLFNIGGEGQYVMAAISTVAVAWYGQDLPRMILIPLILLVGFFVGGMWGAIAGFLKAKRGINEVISTIMLNWIALYISNYLVRIPLSPNVLAGDTPAGHTVIISDVAKLTKFKEIFPAFGYSSAHTGILIALAAAVIMWFILFKTTVGYEIRTVGLSPLAAEYGGINNAKNTVLAMFLSGGLAGLGGAVQISGLVFMVNQSSMLPGYGFIGLSVALVGCSHPLGCIPAALLFGILENGSRQMQLAGIPSEITSIISGVILVFIAGSLLVKIVGDRLKKQSKKTAAIAEKEVA
ncbi:MAG: ABC transporter permease [Clostridia bacterium]|nr:ABC transporter permease [Clostridia bacterium]